jgi:hypothetical protein
MGQQGGVGGDCFVKVAYEEAYTSGLDGDGNPQPGVMQKYNPGKVRILPLNSAFCFPEWHPHDRNRLLRFKLKYRFWGTSAEGTRQVFTYTELLTDDAIEEYVNDELLDSRPNPLGTIPVVHIANLPASGSPWGLSDIQDIIALNREYNEKATEISDILNYHAAPVTVLIGAKASQLEKGAKKVWAIPNKDASIQNLGLTPMQYLEMIKRSMHEITGVPETALGQVQPISNTSGVALAIQYQPMMNRYNLKKIQYGQGIANINKYVMLTLAVKEPESLQWDPNTDVPLREGQLAILDPMDPITYQSTVHWPPPLPIDPLVILNEIQLKMGLGLESAKGALRALGEEFPDEKIQEIFAERMDDAKMQGALQLLSSQIASTITEITGIIPEIGGDPEQAPASEDGSTPAPGGPSPVSAPASMTAMNPQDVQNLMTELVTQAYGTKLPGRRLPDNTDNN